MPWEVGEEGSASEEKIPTFWDKIEINQKDVIMSLVDCPYCNRRLRVPETYSGRLTCPSCSKCFQHQNGSILDEYGKQVVLSVTDNRSGRILTYILFELLFYAVIVILSMVVFLIGV